MNHVTHPRSDRGSVCCASSRSRSGAPAGSAAAAAIRSGAKTGVRANGRPSAARAIEADAHSTGGASRASPMPCLSDRQHAPRVPVAPRSFATSDSSSPTWIRLQRQHVEKCVPLGTFVPGTLLLNHEAAIPLPSELPRIDSAGPDAGRDQPGVLAARPSHFSPRDRRVCDPVQRVLDRRVLPRRQPAARRRPWAWRSSREWRRTSRTTTST